jgi:hypothetical protein|tara:strand:- start:1797 stop:2414 length:618 start_codon:yes stop_codon:yes gene_type:complete
MKIIELFSGTESFSKVARERGHEVFTIDNNSKFKSYLCKDILEVNIRDIPFKPDIIWASPPCIDYSHAKRKGVSYIELSNMYVIKTISLILALKPKFWVIENPQTGTLKFQYFMYELPYTDVSYCKYGYSYRKQTRLWNNFNFKGKVCNKDCKFMIDGKHINSAGNGREKYTFKGFNKIEKGSVPKELCVEIIKCCERIANTKGS